MGACKGSIHLFPAPPHLLSFTQGQRPRSARGCCSPQPALAAHVFLAAAAAARRLLKASCTYATYAQGLLNRSVWSGVTGTSESECFCQSPLLSMAAGQGKTRSGSQRGLASRG